MKQSGYREEIIQDVRFAARQLGRGSASTAIATLTLAIGIDATTAEQPFPLSNRSERGEAGAA